MISNLQAQSGSCRRSMWCGAAEQTGMPSPTEQDQWGACTYFGGVSIGRAPYGVPSASRCELITRLHLAAVIEGINVSKAFRRVRITGMSDLSRSSIVPANASACMRNMDLNQQVSPMGRHGNADDIFVGQRDKISARTTFLYLNGRPGYWRDGRCMSTLDSRTPHAEKVSAHRPRQIFFV